MEQQDTIGVVTFFSSQHAIHAQEVLERLGYTVSLIPGPKEISPNCGVALRFERQHREAVEAALKADQVLYEAVHLYAEPKEKSLLKKLLGY